MAEQAINTIYLLGEQPDQLCSALIKSLTARVFSQPSSSAFPPAGEPPTPADEEMSETPAPSTTATSSPSKVSDGGDKSGSFALAQLVFTVGHVAIKHIVYLELVEREFKRRKDEKAKGKQQRIDAVRQLTTCRESSSQRKGWQRPRCCRGQRRGRYWRFDLGHSGEGAPVWRQELARDLRADGCAYLRQSQTVSSE